MESTSAASGKSSEDLKLPPVVVRKELHTLIGSVKEMQLVTTYQEVLEGLQKYIWQKKLFDPQNPYKVCCKDDELGSVLGADEFSLHDLKTVLQKLVFPVSKTNRDSAEACLHSASDNSLKRKSNEIDDCDESNLKKVCTVDVPCESVSPIILHIPPSPAKCDSSDSPDSIQGYETAFVKDTSDDLGGSPEYFTTEEGIFAIEETFDLEYEVETDSSVYSVDSGDSSDSDSEIDIAAQVALDAAILTFVCRTDSDIEFFADNSSDEDAEISKSDKWQCGKCSYSNHPTSSKCQRCWEERLGWLPEKDRRELPSPPRKRRKQRKSQNSISSKEGYEKDEDEICLKASSQEYSADEASSSKCTQDSQGSSTDFECTPEIKESSSTSSETGVCNSCESTQKQCIICCAKPANASIIHGKYAHQISCYKCARKLQKQKKRCPICRRTIDRVVHQITNV